MDKEKAYLHSEEEAVKMAIEKEIAVRKFYADNVVRMKSALTKKTFEFLAAQEQKHEDTIRNFNTEFLNGKKPDVTTQALTEEMMKQFLGTNIEAARAKFTAKEDEIGIYELAKDREYAAYTFYKKAAEDATHQNVKKLFEFLTKEEDAHYHLLANVISYLKSPSHYFMDNEEWNFEGA